MVRGSFGFSRMVLVHHRPRPLSAELISLNQSYLHIHFVSNHEPLLTIKAF